MAKRKASKDSRPDFLRDQGDRMDKISAQDLWSAITLKHEPTRKVVGFLLVVFAAVLAIASAHPAEHRADLPFEPLLWIA